MILLIKNKTELTQFVSKIEKFIDGTYIQSKHQRIKECIAKSLGFKKYASLLNELPIKINTETFGLKYFTQSDKMFATKANDKITFFASLIQDKLIRDFVSDDIEECLRVLMKLEYPEVFVDRGWGDQPLAISIINDGNGQFPYLYITNDVYKELKAKSYIGENILQTYKARKLHVFDKRKVKN